MKKELRELQHTPGPWSVKQRSKGLVASCVNAGSFHILLTNDKGAFANEWEANAHLIAAAPDLLKQLKALVVQIEFSGHLIVPPNVKAAIAKAEGRKL